METSGIKRRLTCILAADAVGYSRLMSADEEGACGGRTDPFEGGNRRDNPPREGRG